MGVVKEKKPLFRQYEGDFVTFLKNGSGEAKLPEAREGSGWLRFAINCGRVRPARSAATHGPTIRACLSGREVGWGKMTKIGRQTVMARRIRPRLRPRSFLHFTQLRLEKT